jgi:hypothetical protein
VTSEAKCKLVGSSLSSTELHWRACLTGWASVKSTKSQFLTAMPTQNSGHPVALLVTCFSAGFLLSLFFDPNNVGLPYNGLHGVISQKIILFITTTVIASKFSTWKLNFYGFERPKAEKGYLHAHKLQKSYLMQLKWNCRSTLTTFKVATTNFFRNFMTENYK